MRIMQYTTYTFYTTSLCSVQLLRMYLDKVQMQANDLNAAVVWNLIRISLSDHIGLTNAARGNLSAFIGP